MIDAPGSARVYLACGTTYMRKGFDRLAAQVQTMLSLDPHNGAPDIHFLCVGDDYVAAASREAGLHGSVPPAAT